MPTSRASSEPHEALQLNFSFGKVKLLRSEIACGNEISPNGEVKEKFNFTMSKANNFTANEVSNFIGEANFTKKLGFGYALNDLAKEILSKPLRILK